MAAVRDGHIPILLLEKVTGLEFDKSDMAPAKYPHSPYFKDLYNQKQLSEAH